MNPALRNETIERWFGMWLRGEGQGLEELFTPDCVYIESWGPEYDGVEAIRHWFDEWNTRARVISWDIKRIDHVGDRSYVEWFFEDRMSDGRAEVFEGVSIIEWQGTRIARLKEFGCKILHPRATPALRGREKLVLKGQPKEIANDPTPWAGAGSFYHDTRV